MNILNRRDRVCGVWHAPCLPALLAAFLVGLASGGCVAVPDGPAEEGPRQDAPRLGELLGCSVRRIGAEQILPHVGYLS